MAGCAGELTFDDGVTTAPIPTAANGDGTPTDDGVFAGLDGVGLSCACALAIAGVCGVVGGNGDGGDGGLASTNAS